MTASPPLTTSRSLGTHALLVLLAGQAMGSFDGSAVTVAAPGIQADLRCSGSTLQLLLSGYLVAFGILVVPGARWGDDIGHRRVFVAGLAGFTCASLTCGVAPWAALLIVSRILQGAGAALMLPQVLSIVQLTSSGRARERALSLYSATLALGVILGQVLGGFLVRADLLGTGWRAVFLVNVPLGVLLLAVAPRVLPSPAGNRPRPLRPRDATLLAVASGLLLLPLLVGREQHWPGWV
jgi:MFS family permease